MQLFQIRLGLATFLMISSRRKFTELALIERMSVLCATWYLKKMFPVCLMNLHVFCHSMNRKQFGICILREMAPRALP